MIKVGVLGSTGKMGKLITHLLQTEYADRALLAAAAGSDDPLEPFLQTDVILDVSSPEAVVDFAKLAAQAKKIPPLILGSTGWNPEQKKFIDTLVKQTSVMMCANFSVGVAALMNILKVASPMLSALGYSPVIVETHHHHKKDAPSGTAMAMLHAIDPNRNLGVQMHSIRAGEVIGDHEVTFYGPADTITIKHSAQDRSLFARGAIEIALWLSKNAKTPGMIPLDQFFKEKFKPL